MIQKKQEVYRLSNIAETNGIEQFNMYSLTYSLFWFNQTHVNGHKTNTASPLFILIDNISAKGNFANQFQCQIDT